MFKMLQVPVDLSDPDHYRDAVTTAASLASQYGATLRLITVVPPLPGMVAEYLPAETHEQMLGETREKLEEIVGTLELGDGRAEIAVREGSVYHEVLEDAQEADVDLIIMGSHRPAMRTYLIGSNAARIVRHAPCSVMVLRGES
jgi:universal stress protein F